MVKLIDFPGETYLDINPDKVLSNSVGKLDFVLVLGYEKETGDLYFAGSSGSDAENLLLLKKFEKYILTDKGD